jgi:hypothetical protein
MSIKAQKMVDTAPIKFSGVSAIPVAGKNTSFTVYNGLVPISPYTTPIAPKVNAAVDWRLMCADGLSESIADMSTPM